jgi:hypothetical protein
MCNSFGRACIITITTRITEGSGIIAVTLELLKICIKKMILIDPLVFGLLQITRTDALNDGTKY